MDEFEKVNVSTGMNINQAQAVVASGQALMQTKSEYQCAVTVQKPRELAKVRQEVLKEARLAKDEFFYRWPVKNKNGSQSWVEGGSVGLAQSIMSNYTNCAIIPKVEEKNGRWYFETVFVDFEKGVTTARHLIQKMPTVSLGKHSVDRTVNMEFQKAQSKNIRDTIFNAIPRWLRSEAIEEAKEASTADVLKNRDKILKKALEFFETKNITDTELAAFLGKKDTKFNNKDIEFMRNLVVQLRNGDTTPEAIKEASASGFEAKTKKDTQQPPPPEQANFSPPPKEEPKKEEKPEERPEFEILTTYNVYHFNKIKTPESMSKFLVACPIEKIASFPVSVKEKIEAKYKRIMAKGLFESLSTPQPEQKPNDAFFEAEFSRVTGGFAFSYFKAATKFQMDGFMNANKDKIKDFPGPIVYEISKKYFEVYKERLQVSPVPPEQPALNLTPPQPQPTSSAQQKIAEAIETLGQELVDQAQVECKQSAIPYSELSDAQCADLLVMIGIVADSA